MPVLSEEIHVADPATVQSYYRELTHDDDSVAKILQKVPNKVSYDKCEQFAFFICCLREQVNSTVLPALTTEHYQSLAIYPLVSCDAWDALLPGVLAKIKEVEKLLLAMLENATVSRHFAQMAVLANNQWPPEDAVCVCFQNVCFAIYGTYMCVFDVVECTEATEHPQMVSAFYQGDTQIRAFKESGDDLQY